MSRYRLRKRDCRACMRIGDLVGWPRIQPRCEILRVVLIGQAAFAEKALETLHARGEEIVHAFVPPDAPGSRPDPAKAKAEQLGVPLSQPASFRGETALDHFKSLNADLCVMAFVTIIVPERILFAPRLKTICFHPSLLPRHRGASAINWAITRATPKPASPGSGPTAASIAARSYCSAAYRSARRIQPVRCTSTRSFLSG